MLADVKNFFFTEEAINMHRKLHKGFNFCNPNYVNGLMAWNFRLLAGCNSSVKPKVQSHHYIKSIDNGQ